MIKEHYFSTPVWFDDKPEYLDFATIYTDKYIEEAKQRFKTEFKTENDFGFSHHSTSLIKDTNLAKLTEHFGKSAYDFLVEQNVDMDNYTLIVSEMWVQEFGSKGGHHNAHVHWNDHISGFYFLKCSDQTSKPIFHDPRPAAEMIALKQKDPTSLINNPNIHFNVHPGTMMLFPAYLKHEFSIDPGKEPFRFIHFNVRAVQKGLENSAG